MRQKYSSYKDSGVDWIGEIPSHWKILKIKNTCEIENSQISQSELNGLKVIHYSIPNVQEFGSGKLEEGDDIDSSKIVVKGGEVLFSKLNPRKGTTCIVQDNNDLLKVCSGEFITMKTTLNNTKFHWYLVSSMNFIQFIDSQVESVTRSHQRIRPDNFLSSLIPIPPFQEQQQIVTFLDQKTSQIDTLVSLTEKKIELLKEKRTSLINEAVTKGLDKKVKMKDSGVEWIGKIPEGWELRKGSTIGSYSKGNGIKKDEVKEFGLPCIRYGEIYTYYDLRFSETKSFIDEFVADNSVKVSFGTLLLTGSGETLEDIGKCVVFVGKGDVYVGGDIIILRPNGDFHSEFLSYQINSESLRIQREMSGKGGIIVHIYSKNFREMFFPTPPLQEQQQIVDYIDQHTSEIDKLISIEQRRITTLKEYRQSLISEVVTGKVKVK